MSSEFILEPSDVEELERIQHQNPDKVIILDFFATWCGPCKDIAPLFMKLAEKNKHMIFVKIDVDEAEDVCTKYNINVMPTFIFLKNGEQIDHMESANFEGLEEKVQKWA